MTLHGWIPTSLELNAVVDDVGLAGLRSVLPLETQPDADFPAAIRGNGKPYTVTCRVRACENRGEPTPVYRTAVQAAMADLAAAIRDPSHKLLVTAADGAASLAVALAARESAQAGRGVEI